MTDDDALTHLAALAPAQGAPRLDGVTLAQHVANLPGWSIERDRLVKTFTFDDFPTTILFVNALAFAAQRMDHHPDMEVGYRRCRVAWTTHDADGITRNDCIAAARTERLVA